MVCGCRAGVAPGCEVAPVQGVDGGRMVLVGGMGVGEWWRWRPEPRVVLQAAGVIWGNKQSWSMGSWLGATPGGKNSHRALNKTAGVRMNVPGTSKLHVKSFSQICSPRVLLSSFRSTCVLGQKTNKNAQPTHCFRRVIRNKTTRATERESRLEHVRV